VNSLGHATVGLGRAKRFLDFLAIPLKQGLAKTLEVANLGHHVTATIQATPRIA
jgi:hypothetical protein